MKHDHACCSLQGLPEPQIALKGTQVAGTAKQGAASLSGGSSSKPPVGPNSPSRVMRNSSSLRKGGDASYPGLADLAGAVDLAPEDLAGQLLWKARSIHA